MNLPPLHARLPVPGRPALPALPGLHQPPSRQPHRLQPPIHQTTSLQLDKRPRPTIKRRTLPQPLKILDTLRHRFLPRTPHGTTDQNFSSRIGSQHPHFPWKHLDGQHRTQRRPRFQDSERQINRRFNTLSPTAASNTPNPPLGIATSRQRHLTREYRSMRNPRDTEGVFRVHDTLLGS